MSTAVEISLGKNNTLTAFIPSPAGSVRHVSIPLSIDGLRLLRSILRERGNTMPRVSEPGSPTQHEIDTWLREMRREATEQAKQKKLIAETEARENLSRTFNGIDLSQFKL